MTDTPETKPFEPVIIGFTCNWCSYRAADMAGTARMKYAPNVRLIRLMCSGRLDPTFVFKAFAGGADAVLVSGCHPGDCHYISQNYKAMRRFHLMQRVLAQLGIEPGRLKLLWASAAEGAIFAREITKFTEEVRALGPLNWNKNHAPETTENAASSVVDGQPSTVEVTA
jgi:F420-non-reducing hydrogenase iron-sulfur subunit